MRVNGNRDTFDYYSGLWTNGSLYNSDPTALAGADEFLLQPYLDTPGYGFLIFMTAPNGRQGVPLSLSVQFRTMLQLFQGGYTPTSAAPSAWYSMIYGGATYQPNCNYQGINVDLRLYRIGIVGNNENDCSTPDAALGIGGSSSTLRPSSVAGVDYVCCATVRDICGFAAMSVTMYTIIFELPAGDPRPLLHGYHPRDG
jgi:hypothetical protein